MFDVVLSSHTLACCGSALLWCLLYQQTCLLFSARQTPVNFVVLPVVSAGAAVHCGKDRWLLCSRAEAAAWQVVMSLAAVRSCLALCVC